MEQSTGTQHQVACIRVPNFCWQVEAGRQSALDGPRPVLITCSGLELSEVSFENSSKFESAALASERLVLDCSPGVTDITAGMPLEVALSRHSNALLVQGDLPLYISAFESLLVEFERLIPAVEVEGPGTAYIDLDGLDRLYGQPIQVIRRIAEAAEGFDLRIGIGQNKWQAYLASLISSPRVALRVSGDPERFVGGFSTALLPVPYRTIEQLQMFGLDHLADIAKLPQGPMEAQFGLPGRLMWRLANGIDDRPLLARNIVESVSEYLVFPDATVSMMAVFSGIESLLGMAFAKPQMDRRYARKAFLQAEVFRKPPWVMEVAFKEPAGSKDHAISGIKAKLDTVQFPGPLEDLRLTLTDLSSEPWRQESAWKEVQKEDNLRQAIGQLAARLGVAPPIYQVRALEPWSRIPERRHALVQLSH